MKKAIIIPIYLKLREPGELPYSNRLKLDPLSESHSYLLLSQIGLFKQERMEESKGVCCQHQPPFSTTQRELSEISET